MIYMMKSPMSSVWVEMTPSSHLLIFRVLRSEVAAHQLEFEAEMRQSVQQIHPPRRRVVHHSCHPEQLPAGYHFAVPPDCSRCRCEIADDSCGLAGLRNVHINNKGYRQDCCRAGKLLVGMNPLHILRQMKGWKCIITPYH